MSVAVASRSEDSDTEIVPVPMDRATRLRLVTFAKGVGKTPVEAASMLLRDVLHSDLFWNAASRGETTH